MSVNKLKNTLKKFSEKDKEFAKFLEKEHSNDDNDDEDDDDDEYDAENDKDDMDIDDSNEDYSDNSDEESSSSNDGVKELVVASDDEYSDIPDTDSNSDSMLPSADKSAAPSKVLVPANSIAETSSLIITIKIVNKWRRKLQCNCVESLKSMITGFKAAVIFTSNSSEQCEYVVKGGTVYNAIIGACIVDIVPALQNILSYSNQSNRDPMNSNINSSQSDKRDLKGDSKSDQLAEGKFIISKNWKVIKLAIKSYILDVLKLLSIIGNDDLLLDLLKHFYDLCHYIVAFPKFHKPVTKKCIEMWATGKEESVRIMSLRCILVILPCLSDKMVEFTLSKMFISFQRNSRFTSANTLPEISYMRRSLVELLTTRPRIAYRSSFLNMRQMARLLHNALKLQKKEVKQSICNWQFVHPLLMYCVLIGRLHGDEYVNSLAHPIVEIILGTIRLNQGVSYFPLRITFLRSLIEMAKQTKIYIPAAPYILEILDFPSLSKNPRQTSIKSINMDCILKASKTEIKEKAFCDALIEGVFELSLSFLSGHASSIAFPELALPFIIQLKKFLKECKVLTYTRKMKLLLTKIEENIKLVERTRKNVSINLADQNSVERLEAKIVDSNPPLSIFFSNWLKVSIKNREILANPKQKDIEDFPKIIRTVRPVASEEDRQQFKGLFMQDSDQSESDDDVRFEIKDEKNARLKKRSASEKKQKESNVKKESKSVGKKLKLNNGNAKAEVVYDGELSGSEPDVPDIVEEFDYTNI